MKKILFLAGGYPIYKSAGSILYQRIIETYGVEHFCYYALSHKDHTELPNWFINVPNESSTLRIWKDNRWHRYLKLIPLIEEFYYLIAAYSVSRRIRRFINDNKIELIVAVLRSDVLAVINKITEKSQIPILGFISDTVEAEYDDKPILFRYKVKEYYKSIQNSKGIFVAGETMECYIKEEFNKEASILRLGFKSNILNNRESFLNNKAIRVFFSGSVYAYEEFESFVKSLSKLASKYLDFSFTLVTATTYVMKSQPTNLQIVNLGWVQEEDLIDYMQKSTFSYLPYKFDKKDEMQMTYAFPNKTGFYLSTGLPIFFHGPIYSSMSKFIEKYQCGIHCSSMDEDLILFDIEKLLFDDEFYDQCKSAAIEAFENEFSINVLMKNFKSLVDSQELNSSSID